MAREQQITRRLLALRTKLASLGVKDWQLGGEIRAEIIELQCELDGLTL